MADWKEDGYHSVTPYLIVDDAAAAIDFYKAAFGAEEVMRMPMGDKIGHADLLIGDSHIMLADEFPDMDKLGPNKRGGGTCSLMIYVENSDAAFDQAVAAGATAVRPVEDQFFGDRSGWVKDPFGHEWTLSTHIEDVSPEELNRRMAEMMAGEGA
ncbi:PhnB protein [Parasphingorhabdus marina DSM 22363]|uniref:PhnB protein n=1 Tax=Parasphingorhabdus marina DSM 22363 TaxID=1123272 RepID=A0A1N6GV64_9SPHN|nr:VOC family protein [Parasphingorhabdus marina]SIO11450.1 PhnB protein [Parasphingorhabdus marina DSM 22363]